MNHIRMLIRCLFMVAVLLVIGVHCETRVISSASFKTEEGVSLQQLIDQARSGDTLLVPSGTFQGPITLDKPLNLKAEGTVVIMNRTNKPAVHIRAAGVHMQGMQIIQDADEKSAAILVSAKETILDSLNIQTRSYGIMLRDADRNEIRNAKIQWMIKEGYPAVKMSDKRNGIDLYNSHDNRIVENEISSMNDGIYLESSHRSIVEKNRIDHSRYGIHCMYTDETAIRSNIGSFNITGAMVMGVKDAEVSGNTFVKQSENVNSQGLLLFDVQTSRIHGNKVEGNRVGMYIEQSQNNELWNNAVVQNFIGIQLLESEGNRFRSNNFIGNVIESAATDSKNNMMSANYWDAFRGIDLNGDGLSEMKYAMNPFFQRLTAKTPAFQLFFQSPGMSFLESLFTADQAGWAADDLPSMDNVQVNDVAHSDASQAGTLGFSLILLVVSITTIILMGVKRT